jgi:hypothetical protein
MKRKHPILFITALALVMINSCEPIEKVSIVPEINFKSYTALTVDTLGNTIDAGELVFSFVDGDSDIGMYNDSANFFLIPYQKLNSEYLPLDANIYGRKYTISEDDRLHKYGSSLRGEINLKIFYFITPPFDTIRYNFYIMDRAGHFSNIDSTTDIAF